ncbi:nitroreductase/quinone reductase family protein [Lapillicoccus sp.]|uniref:nitroreductase/quinone reductase family protein n=1 Tax=Lapillicoccus sp. TaxID=1909287 RepID=UPI0025F3601F|nr:nitroreductase/quinone reductase family protein [Lapillicoccus sp.]
MMFHREGERVVVIASNMGAADDPSWCVNLRADPQVSVEIGDERYAATAHVLAGEDRAAVWGRIQAAYPFFVEHEESAGAREIPLVELVRVGEG